MIIEVQKDLLTSDADIIAHQTNCVGVMGAGVAKQIKEKLLTDEEFLKYQEKCTEYGPSLLGSVQLLHSKNGKYIANLFGENIPTGTGLDTNYIALRKSLKELKDIAKRYDLTIAIPGYLGCGLAGGDWERVFEMIYTIFKDSTVKVEICHLQN